MLKSKLTAAVLAALALGYASATLAATDASTPAPSSPQDTSNSSQSGAQDEDATKKAKKLEAVTVTGSLIPQSQVETAQPVISITAEDMKARGFTTVAEALQQASFATGSVQGPQDNNSFTTGAQTLSMFGLPVGFTKYLIDGRPMGNFPGLYNGSDVFNNISNIPMEMVDHIDVLPGGQSSLYGSDAIAGVVNIVLKKHVDAPTIDVRAGAFSEGGGANQRISFADSFNFGKFNTMIGVQYEQQRPIWGYDRDLTKTYNQNGTTPAVASRDYLVLDAIAGKYLMLDPSNCAGVSSGYNGQEGLQNRPGRGQFCGSFPSAGYSTIDNQTKSANLYSHSTFDVNDNLQLYGDLLYNYQEQKFTSGTNTTFWSTQVDTAASGGGYYWDPNLGTLALVQRIFTPEEVGGYSNIMNKQYENSYMLTLGGKGTIGQSNWDYDLGFTHSDDHLVNRDFQRFAGPIEQYFSDHVLGRQQGTYSGYPIFTPDYGKLYSPVSTSDFRSFTGYTTSESKTWDNMIRGQLTNQSLFRMAGGDAGLAVVLEGGNQGWDSTPDPRLLQTITDVNGNVDPYVWGTSSTPGSGHRSRYAGTAELRMPLLEQLVMDTSLRYDSYNVDGHTVSHPTYNVGLEYRPLDTFLLRGRYGSAFKVPTLADEFQGPSNYYNTVTDYLNCNRMGVPPEVASVACKNPYDNTQYKGLTYGNPDLQPITAKVWSYGFVWAPVERMSLGIDYLHWNINNEVAQINADQLSRTQYLCDVGTYSMSSQLCTQAFNLITRGPGNNGLLGQITNITTPKLNIASEELNAITANFSYVQPVGAFGQLALALSYSDVLKHTTQDYATDPKIDVLRHPAAYPNGTDFKSKANGSLTWSKDEWSATVYFNRYGSSPNYEATLVDNYTAPGTGKLAPWILYNASVTYNPLKNLGLSLLVNNVFNKMPPKDDSYDGLTNSPYNTDNYNVFGRAIYLEANYKFGSNH
ncbi:TonB-dependent receptor domain-containing protein [Dyella kyungheensis]|jgi:outer membrane receptor protein involved in Fe transport|uniref:TonB-dependent receptor n=1 Tax=Dyella kyungheensis TaxID=1242174 RepID=A0ABS2JWP0_9GAMM|nr:TonB-dependent receptor [Dyella kyungheensis]MBM7123438.1 TonB-dependent receptor [Dyella kyungheensis]